MITIQEAFQDELGLKIWRAAIALHVLNPNWSVCSGVPDQISDFISRAHGPVMVILRLRLRRRRIAEVGFIATPRKRSKGVRLRDVFSLLSSGLSRSLPMRDEDKVNSFGTSCLPGGDTPKQLISQGITPQGRRLLEFSEVSGGDNSRELVTHGLKLQGIKSQGRLILQGANPLEFSQVSGDDDSKRLCSRKLPQSSNGGNYPFRESNSQSAKPQGVIKQTGYAGTSGVRSRGLTSAPDGDNPSDNKSAGFSTSNCTVKGYKFDSSSTFTVVVTEDTTSLLLSSMRMAWVRAITLMVHFLQNISMPMSNQQNKNEIMIQSAENEVLQNTGVKKTLSAKGPINAKDINSEQSGTIDKINGSEKDSKKDDSKQDDISFPNRVENHHCSNDGGVIQDTEAKEGFIATHWTNVRDMLSGLLEGSCSLTPQTNTSVTIGPQHELNRDLNHEDHEPTEVQDNLDGLSVFDESEDDDEPFVSQLEIEDEHQVNMFLLDCKDSLQGENNSNIGNVAPIIPMVPEIVQWNHLNPDPSEEAPAPNAPVQPFWMVHVHAQAQAPQESPGANEEAPVSDPWLVAQGNHENQPAQAAQVNAAQEYPGNQELNDGADSAQGALQAPEAVQVNENGEQVPGQESVLPPPPCPLLHPPQAKQHGRLGFDESEEEDEICEDEPIVSHLEIEDEDQVDLFLQDGQGALHGENNGNMENIAPDVPMLPGNLQWNHFIPAHPDEAPGPHAPVQLLPFWVLQYQAYQAHVHAQAQAPQEPPGANEEAPNNAPLPDPWLEAQGNHGNQLAQANQVNAAQENEGNQEMNDGADVVQEAPQAPEAVQVNENGEQVDEDGAPANGGVHDHVPVQEAGLPPPLPPPLHPPQAMQHGSQHLHANGARGRLVAAARYLRRRLRRGNHGNHPHGPLMYIPGGQGEERLPLGLEEAPPVLGGYVVAPDEEERRSRWFSRCFAFIYRYRSATVQQYPLQSDEAPEFEEVAGVVQEVNEDIVEEAA